MGEKLLSLSWNNHGKTYRYMFNALRKQGFLTDITLACDGRQFGAHKLVLASCSDYFKAMLGEVPCSHPIMYLRGVSAKEMQAMLEFMYTGQTRLPQGDVKSLLATAEALRIKGLGVKIHKECTSDPLNPVADPRCLMKKERVEKSIQSNKSDLRSPINQNKRRLESNLQLNDGVEENFLYENDSEIPSDPNSPSPKKRKSTVYQGQYDNLPYDEAIKLINHKIPKTSQRINSPHLPNSQQTIPLNMQHNIPSNSENNMPANDHHNTPLNRQPNESVNNQHKAPFNNFPNNKKFISSFITVKSEPNSIDMQCLNSGLEQVSEVGDMSDITYTMAEIGGQQKDAMLNKTAEETLTSILEMEEKGEQSNNPDGFYPDHSAYSAPREALGFKDCAAKDTAVPSVAGANNKTAAAAFVEKFTENGLLCDSKTGIFNNNNNSNTAAGTFEEETQMIYLEAFTRSAGLSKPVVVLNDELTVSLTTEEAAQGSDDVKEHKLLNAKPAAEPEADVENRPFPCPICRKTFGKAAILKRHHLAHFRPYSCSMCERSFTRREVLAEHLQEHNGADTRLPCPVCAMTIKRKRNLQAHIKVKHPDYYWQKRQNNQSLF